MDNSPRFVGRSPRKKTARIVTQIIPVDSIMGVTFNSTPRYANTLITVVPNRSPYPRITLQFKNLNKIFCLLDYCEDKMIEMRKNALKTIERLKPEYVTKQLVQYYEKMIVNHKNV